MAVDLLDAQYDARDRLLAALKRDLVGPADQEEMLTDAPMSTYVAGVLYPQDAGTIDPEQEVDEEDDAGETTYADPPVSLANMRYPASMGLTFAVNSRVADEVTVVVKAARYEPHTDDQGQETWRRKELELVVPPVSVTAPGRPEHELEPGLSLFQRVRPADADGSAAVTIVLINQRRAEAGKRDAHCYFQVGITVSAGGAAAFVDRSSGTTSVDDPDLDTYRLIYRDARNYAVGHGTSVMWEEAVGAPGATEVRTEPVPHYELLVAESNPLIPTDRLSMRFLATGTRAEVGSALTELADGYGAWVHSLEERIPALEDEALQSTARLHIDDCNRTLNRMRTGIATLAEDDAAWRAFQLANLAMLKQRARAEWIAGGRDAAGPTENDAHSWRPFQIAFILLNVSGIADPRHEDRELLDLLWFPTGGGKTEAYLGLIGFTICLRRLRNGVRGGGTTVLMRYTLRLLTIQQFERAASLICALEHLRGTEADDLGATPISIGLWVGRDGTPSRVSEARTALDKINVGTVVEKGNPIQVRACPWCGTRLDRKAYWITRNDPRLVISCRNKDGCEFSKALPIHVVDEDIYRERPTLIIATADKFATLPWVKGTHTLFGLDETTPPPELIVQDELHLISGPLGTLAGLYEAAIDLLCTANGIRPKVIASTATIRRAGPQAQALFDRSMRQFPPPGLEASDSHFAVTADRSSRASRLYVGALAPGTSQSTLMIRVYAALMQTVYEMDALPQVKDPYWTLVGYFNSLRVLGGARIQVLDDVRERLRVVASEGDPRPVERNIELTSREPSADIPGHLERLAVSLPDPETLDYVLATNMISVGVDVDRLGLMAVMGQPQATAEYIQATSRVGRAYPGLVLALYNASRSRDRSHYESFPAYHAALYRQVESTSVTPFSPRARDRALHAVLLSLARTAIPELRENAAARDIEAHVDKLGPFIDAIADRADRIEPGAGEAARAELARTVEQWRARNREAPSLVYANPRDEINSLLASADKAEGDGFPTASSLRDVDQESNLYLVRV